MQREARTRHQARQREKEANKQRKEEYIRNADNDEDIPQHHLHHHPQNNTPLDYSDEDEDEGSSGEDEEGNKKNRKCSTAVENFANWVSDAWPGVVARRLENGTIDSRTYPSEELLLMSRLCQSYGKTIGAQLVDGFNQDLNKELIPKINNSTTNSSSIFPPPHGKGSVIYTITVERLEETTANIFKTNIY